MSKCLKCGMEITGQEKFCKGCGTKIYLCKQCGAPYKRGVAFCESCGSPVQENTLLQKEEPRQATQSKFNKKFMLSIVLGLIILLGIGAGGFYYYQNIHLPEQQRLAQEKQRLAEIEEFQSRIQGFIASKNNIDRSLTELASRINASSNGRGFYNNIQLSNTAKNLADQATKNAGDLAKLSVNDSKLKTAKKLLVELFNLEYTRANSLYTGLVESRRGLNYSTSFQVGTDAAYQYDEVDAKFNKAMSDI